MKRFASLLIALMALLFVVGIASADPANGNNAVTVPGVACENGWSGTVLAPSNYAAAGFVGDTSIGIVRSSTVTVVSTGEIFAQFSHPGKGYDTVGCWFEATHPLTGELLHADLEVQWIERGH